MSVPVGYKATEVGVIPVDWEVNPLGSLTNLMTNGFVGKAKSHYVETGNGTLYLQGYNVLENDFNLHGVKFVSQDFHNKNQKSCLKSGDLLTVQTGDVGLTTIVPESLANSNCHALIISRFIKNKAHSKYVSYYLNSEPGRSRLRLIETGTTMKHLNVGDMLKFEIPLPPNVAEQYAIAEALSDVDEAIAAQEAVIAKKRALKTATMQALLSGTRRLPGFGDPAHVGQFKQAEVGNIPLDWEVARLGDVGKPVIGLTYSPRDVRETGTLVLRSSNVQNGALAFENNVYVDPLVATKAMVLRNDILICVRNGSRDLIGKCAKIDARADGMAFGAFMSVFRSAEHGFVFHQFQSDLMRRQINEHLGATINQITNGSLIAFKIPWPPMPEERHEISCTLSDIDDELAHQESKLAKLRHLKTGMMQQLLTGKIRLI